MCGRRPRGSTATSTRRSGPTRSRSLRRRRCCSAAAAAARSIFSQTQKTARAANPGGRIPRRRALAGPVTITVDTRERYPYKFTHQGAATVRATVTAGDYAIHGSDGTIIAAVERKTLENLAGTLSDGTLAFQMQRLSELPLAAIVIEARYSAIFKLEYVDGTWLADQLARLHVRYPTFTSSTPTPAATPKTGPNASLPPHSQTPPTRTPAPTERVYRQARRALVTQIGITDPFTALRDRR